MTTSRRSKRHRRDALRQVKVQLKRERRQTSQPMAELDPAEAMRLRALARVTVSLAQATRGSGFFGVQAPDGLSGVAGVNAPPIQYPLDYGEGAKGGLGRLAQLARGRPHGWADHDAALEQPAELAPLPRTAAAGDHRRPTQHLRSAMIAGCAVILLSFVGVSDGMRDAAQSSPEKALAVAAGPGDQAPSAAEIGPFDFPEPPALAAAALPAGPAEQAEPAAAVTENIAPAVPPPAAAAKPVPKPKRMPAATPGTSNTPHIQLAALRTQESALRNWEQLRTANPEVLGSLSASVVKVDLGASKGVFYRVLAGPLADTSMAARTCARLKQRQFDCLVVPH